jgi:hypothetical protein
LSIPQIYGLMIKTLIFLFLSSAAQTYIMIDRL